VTKFNVYIFFNITSQIDVIVFDDIEYECHMST
jgi:hypothetical protein